MLGQKRLEDRISAKALYQIGELRCTCMFTRVLRFCLLLLSLKNEAWNHKRFCKKQKMFCTSFRPCKPITTAFCFFGFWVQVILRGQDGIPNHIKGCPLSCMFLEAALQKKEHTRYTKARINSNKRKCPFSNNPECVSLHLKPLLRLTNTKAW